MLLAIHQKLTDHYLHTFKGFSHNYMQYAHTHTRTHTQTRTHTHARTHARTHAHIHACNLQSLALPPPQPHYTSQPIKMSGAKPKPKKFRYSIQWLGEVSSEKTRHSQIDENKNAVSVYSLFHPYRQDPWCVSHSLLHRYRQDPWCVVGSVPL